MRSNYLILLFCGSFLMFGCKKLVDVGVPTNQVTTISVFNNDQTAIAAQLALYAQILSLPSTFNAYTGLSSDELTNFSRGQTNIDLYKNGLNAQTDGSSLPWSVIYNYIYQENAILENTQQSSGISVNIKKLLLGEAWFIRAYLYFGLVNFYSNVPLITTTDYKVNSLMSNTSKSEVYKQIVSDLQAAKSSLSDKFLDATDTAETVDRVRPTTWAASALLARVYLYTSKYDSAEMEATTVINNTSLFNLTDLSSVFLMNSKEAIWQIMPNSTSVATPDGNTFILNKVPGSTTSITQGCSISSQLLSSFEPNDKRRKEWVNSYTDGTTTWFYPYKYKDNSTTSTSLKEYTMVLRLGEQYLIRAEARVNQNKLNDAISDINAIRERAGLADLNPSLNQKQQLLNSVAHERQVELFAEGQRWFDLKRTEAVDTVMAKVTPQKGGTWVTTQQLYPIPMSDIQTAINLTQNPGY